MGNNEGDALGWIVAASSGRWSFGQIFLIDEFMP